MARYLLFTLLLLIAIGLLLAAASAKNESGRVYEMRTYHAAPGKLDALHARFRDHTVKLFEKHGITSVGYFVPIENEENVLIYWVSYPSREARDASWKAFKDDPDWKTAYEASTVDGKLVEKIDSVFMTATDYSPEPEIAAAASPRVFELRTYTAAPGKLAGLNARFRDHTIELFKIHGMTNVAYFNLMDDQEGADNTLVYLLAHDSVDARSASFKAFSENPAWHEARDASEKEGKLLVAKGVRSVLMTPTDYSPAK